MNALDKAIKTIDAYSYKSAYQDLERAYRMHKNNKPLLKDMIKQWADRHPEKEAKQALKDFEKQHGKMTDKAIKNMDAKVFTVHIHQNSPFNGWIEKMDELDKNGEGKKIKFTDRVKLEKFAKELKSKGFKNYQGY